MSIITSIPPIIMPARLPVVSPRRMPFNIDPSCVLALVPESIGNKWSDISGNGNHGVVTGATRTAKGRLGLTFDFDGFDDGIKRTVSDFESNSISGTLVAWVKVDSSGSGARTIVSSSDEATLEHRFAFRVSNIGNILEIIQDNGDPINTVIATTDLADDTWHQVVCSSNGSAYTFYVDAIVDPITSGANDGAWFGDTDDRDNLTIGMIEHTSRASFFNGLIDEVLIFNKALTQNEITALYEWGRP